MKKLPILFSILALASCGDGDNTAFNYPESRQGPDGDTIFGRYIADPYRWLEDDMSEETKAWVSAQNEVTFGYLNKIAIRDAIRQRLEEVWNYEKLSSPTKQGDFHYYYKNDGLQNQYVMYRKDSTGKEELFLDPNTFSDEGTTSLSDISFTEDGSLVAYSISEGGSDWRKVIVMNATQKTLIEDTLVDIKFSGLSWKDNDGFYYSSYDKPKGSELSQMTDQHKLYYHKLGTPQNTDRVVFGAKPDEKRRYVGGSVSKDGKYLFITGAVSTSGNELYLMDLTAENSSIIPMVTGYEQDAYVLTVKENVAFIVTNLNAPNKRLVKVDLTQPQVEYWTDVIPETEFVLNISKGAGFFFANYMKDAISYVQQFDYDGQLIREIQLPGIGTASGFGGRDEDTMLYYSFTNYVIASSIYTYDPKTGTSDNYWSPNIDYKSDDYVSEQVFYYSKDGTRIPMIITRKKGVELNGKNPTMLYGYGGFNISLTPSFSVSNLVWMEMGGIYAVPNLRGGGEYGKAWHKAGTQQQKQNVFDDFIAAAEYLIENNYTSSDYLAISGRSNGGLLVGATMTQRPDLFKVALPGVGVLDMLRYHKFTAGAGWAYDYGTADDSEEMLSYLLSYSPVHTVKAGVNYPATLIITADHDDRVVPAHSFKFAAELQAKHKGDAPVMIRIDVNAGHGAGMPVSKQIEQNVDLFGFTLHNMGIQSVLF